MIERRVRGGLALEDPEHAVQTLLLQGVEFGSEEGEGVSAIGSHA